MRDKVRKTLRRGLDAYEDRVEKKDNRNWILFSRAIDALDDRPTLKRFLYILLGLELLYWVLVLFFPLPVLHFIEFLNDWSAKSIALVFGVVFGTGLYIAYVFFRFRFPDLENIQKNDGPVIGAYSQQAGIERRFRVWIGSVVVGVINLLALSIVELFRLGNWYRP